MRDLLHEHDREHRDRRERPHAECRPQRGDPRGEHECERDPARAAPRAASRGCRTTRQPEQSSIESAVISLTEPISS